MDESSMAYFSQQLNIRPHCISSHAIAYVKSILYVLKEANSFSGIKPLINMLTTKANIEVEQNKTIQNHAKTNELDTPEKIVEKLNEYPDS